MGKKIDDLLRQQQAKVLTSEALETASGSNFQTRGGTYLTSSFKQPDTLPATASLRRMSLTVALRLAEMGLREPVSLQELPNRWWTVNIDAAELGLTSEYGEAFVSRILSTEELAERGFEVLEGPFRAWENKKVAEAILAKYPEKFWDATISNRPLLPVIDGQERFSGYDDAYSSEALLDALKSGATITVYNGPFTTADDAHYALDVRWETPS